MIIIATTLLGIIFGYRAAKSRGGNRKDIAQYVVAYALGSAVFGLLATVLLERLL